MGLFQNTAIRGTLLFDVYSKEHVNNLLGITYFAFDGENPAEGKMKISERERRYNTDKR